MRLPALSNSLMSSRALWRSDRRRSQVQLEIWSAVRNVNWVVSDLTTLLGREVRSTTSFSWVAAGPLEKIESLLSIVTSESSWNPVARNHRFGASCCPSIYEENFIDCLSAGLSRNRSRLFK